MMVIAAIERLIGQNIPPAEGELSFATRRVKFEGAKREGASKEETVAAAFEAIYDSSPR